MFICRYSQLKQLVVQIVTEILTCNVYGSWLALHLTLRGTSMASTYIVTENVENLGSLDVDCDLFELALRLRIYSILFCG